MERECSHDWQTTKSTIRERNAFMFCNPLMSDIKLVVPNESNETTAARESVRVPAHKYILAISSPVFHAMFYGDLAETKEEIELPDCEHDSLIEFLRYMYSDEVSLTPQNITGIVYLAKKYIVPSLVLKCTEFLEKNLSFENVFQNLVLAQRFDEKNLEKRCWEVIDNETKSCIQCDSFLNIDRATLACFLKRETLMIEELHLFRAVWRWAESKQDSKLNGGQVRELLGDAIFYFRFPAMTLTEFGQNVAVSGILTESEALDVFLHFSGVEHEKEQKFSSVPRLPRMRLIRCARYLEDFTCGSDDSHETWSEELTFSVRKKIFLRGARLYAYSTPGRKFVAELTVRDDKLKSLSSTKGMFVTQQGGKKNWLGFDVLLQNAVHIREGFIYNLKIFITGWEGTKVRRNMRIPQSTGVAGGVQLNFEGTSTQILELLFYVQNGR